jgi:hypothetical protein
VATAGQGGRAAQAVPAAGHVRVEQDEAGTAAVDVVAMAARAGLTSAAAVLVVLAARAEKDRVVRVTEGGEWLR